MRGNMKTENKKILTISSGEVKSLAEIDADYIVIYDKGAEISASELASLAEKMSENDGLTAIVAERGFFAKFNALIYSVASGKKIPVPLGAVGFPREVAATLSGARKYDTVSLVMEAASVGITTHSVSAGESVRFKLSKLISLP